MLVESIANARYQVTTKKLYRKEKVMKTKPFVKSFVKEIIKIPILNTLVRKLLNLRYTYPIVPKTIIEKIPVSGTICVKIPNLNEVLQSRRKRYNSKSLVLAKTSWI